MKPPSHFTTLGFDDPIWILIIPTAFVIAVVLAVNYWPGVIGR